MRRPLKTAWSSSVPILVVLVVAAAFYEGSLALGWTATRPLPERPTEWLVPLLGALALVILALVLASVFVEGDPAPRVAAVVPFVLPAAASLLAARLFSYDPYYLPTLRRLADHGVVPSGWTYALLSAAAVIEGLMLVRRRLGVLLASPVLLVIAAAILAAASGH